MLNASKKRAVEKASGEVAVFSLIIGGVGGFLMFLCSLIYFDAGFLTALGMYLFSGLAVSAGMIVNFLLIDHS